MSINYHMEALRQQRKIDRAFAARERMEKQATNDPAPGMSVAAPDPTLVIAEPGHYDIRSCKPSQAAQRANDARVVFEEVIHDPEYKYRLLKDTGLAPMHVNSIYKIMERLQKFRLNEEGHSNRYRRRQELAPHCEEIYPVLYPSKSNPDYTMDENKKYMRLNRNLDRYEISKAVNGEFHMRVLQETPD